ncbi:MAG: hypothetical protein HY986_13355 [Candidatus Melainabacteria bacterium]|nr:hypothetical protein [Candidatus Melainabacteria bacterium]
MKAQNTGSDSGSSATNRQVSFEAKPGTTNQVSQQVFPASGYVLGCRTQADIAFDKLVGRDWRDN